ncbi:hypothetical protein ACFL16_02620 [Patescibacteria group bacterium]
MMNYSEMFLYFSVGTLAVLVIILLSLIRRIDRQFKEMKGLQLDDMHLEDKINEEVERLQAEQSSNQQSLLKRVKDLESRVENMNIEEEIVSINERLDELVGGESERFEEIELSKENNAIDRNHDAIIVSDAKNEGDISDQIMEMAQSNDSVVSDDLAKALNASDEKIKESLNKLEMGGKLEQIGESGELMEYRIKQQ